MTAQINDRVFHRKIAFSITRFHGTGLFEPGLHGIVPGMMHSACLRGYHVGYVIEDSQLFLTNITFGASDSHAEDSREGRVPSLFGRHARLGGSVFNCWIIDDLYHPITFSGGLLLGANFIQELYLHAGFHPLLKYRDAREVLFENGRLSEDFDLSSDMQAIRTRIREQQLEPRLGNAHSRMVDQWVQECFSRDYTS